MVALPSLSTNMGYKSRNRSPYQTKMPGANTGQRNKRKNDQNDLNRYSSTVSLKQNQNHLVPDHGNLPIPETRGSGSFRQNVPKTIRSQEYPSYNNCNVPWNMSQQPLHQMGNTMSYNPEFMVDSSSLKGSFTTPSQKYFTLNGVHSHSIEDYSEHAKNIHNHIPYAAESGFQINPETNKLLLSLDRNLINLVSGRNSEIPPPQLNESASLKLRRQNVIDALYNKEDNQCPNCGLRFSKDEKEQFQTHLDEHFRKNAELNRIKRGELRNERKWYPSFAKFKSSEIKTNDDNKKKEQDEKIPMIPIDNIILGINNDIVKCSLCHEEFEQVYINDQNLLYKSNLEQEGLKDGWYLKNAIWNSNSDVVHPTC